MSAGVPYLTAGGSGFDEKATLERKREGNEGEGEREGVLGLPFLSLGSGG